MLMRTILLVEDKESLATMLCEALRGDGYEVVWARTVQEAIRALRDRGRYAVVLTDLRLPGGNGVQVLDAVRDIDPLCPVIVMTGYGTVEDAVEAMRKGAWDFLQKPVDIDHLSLLIERCLERYALYRENILLREEHQRTRGLPPILGDSPEIRAVARDVQKVAGTDATVLLRGESGTGKELFARAIHELSSRAAGPFVPINCAAIPDTLIENELFGHEKGAYTGAGSRSMGKFHLADGGTIFLDEIGDLGTSVQSKVLRVIEERQFTRVGGTATIDVDVRIVCATNANLESAVGGGKFREDLFFRINVFPVTIPPLRARRSDIPMLARYFIGKHAAEMGKGEIELSDEAERKLISYDWPGNVRELENSLERAVILCEGSRIEPSELHLGSDESRRRERLREVFDLDGDLPEAVQRATRAVEMIKIRDALRAHPDRHAAAEALGVSYRTLVNKIREYGL
jgi:DNA-binding NtrC family response regulator